MMGCRQAGGLQWARCGRCLVLECRPSMTCANAPRRAGLFCSVSPAAGKTAAGSSFTCADHASPSRRFITVLAHAFLKTAKVHRPCWAEGAG